MNPSDLSTDPAETRWRTHLSTLPDCDPPDALWLRLREARRAARGAAQGTRWPWFASAAALALAALLVPLLQPSSAPPSPSTPATDMRTATVTDPASRASLLRIDAALTRAYERNADDAELDALWQARKGMLDSLASHASAQLLQL